MQITNKDQTKILQLILSLLIFKDSCTLALNAYYKSHNHRLHVI